MSQYIRTIIIPDKYKHAAVEQDGVCKLKDKLVADIVILNGDVDDDVDEMTSMDFTSVRSRLTIKKGFAAKHPLPKFVIYLLELIGIKLDPCVTLALAALYEETGFNDYSREECDKMYINTVLQTVKNGLVRSVLHDILMAVVGNDYKWNNTSDQTSVATLEPIWTN